MMSPNFEELEPDIKQWCLYKVEKADVPMYKDELYTNGMRRMYKVLEDAPAGQENVKVLCNYPVNDCIRVVPKAVILQ